MQEDGLAFSGDGVDKHWLVLYALSKPTKGITLPLAMTQDFKTEYDQLDNFLAADCDWARLDAECTRVKSIVDKQARIAGEAERDFLAFDLCQDTLEYAVHDIPDFRPDNLALFNDELAACQLDRGAKRFERLKRQCMIKGGEASRAWEEATDQLADLEHHLQQRRFHLVRVWNEKQAQKQEAQ